EQITDLPVKHPIMLRDKDNIIAELPTKRKKLNPHHTALTIRRPITRVKRDTGLVYDKHALRLLADPAHLQRLDHQVLRSNFFSKNPPAKLGIKITLDELIAHEPFAFRIFERKISDHVLTVT